MSTNWSVLTVLVSKPWDSEPIWPISLSGKVKSRIEIKLWTGLFNYLFFFYSERFWSTVALLDILQGHFSWQWPCSHHLWSFCESSSWQPRVWPCCTFWCSRVCSCNRDGYYHVFLDWELWWPIRKQGPTWPVQSSCKNHCFWYVEELFFITLHELEHTFAILGKTQMPVIAHVHGIYLFIVI